jgi:hypothetical protein
LIIIGNLLILIISIIFYKVLMNVLSKFMFEISAIYFYKYYFVPLIFTLFNLVISFWLDENKVYSLIPLIIPIIIFIKSKVDDQKAYHSESVILNAISPTIIKKFGEINFDLNTDDIQITQFKLNKKEKIRITIAINGKNNEANVLRKHLNEYFKSKYKDIDFSILFQKKSKPAYG